MSIATLVTGSKLRSNLYLNKNNILGFTVKNRRNRFLIPSNQNLFGTIKVMSPTYTRVIHLVCFLFFYTCYWFFYMNIYLFSFLFHYSSSSYSKNKGREHIYIHIYLE
jgi:hypothetical protein